MDHGHSSILVFAAAAVLTISLSGCSVREDRDLCPCVLTLELDGIRSAGAPPGPLYVCLTGAGGDFRSIDMLEFSDSLIHYRALVPRARIFLDVYSPGSQAGRIGNGYEADSSSKLPDLWKYSDTLDVRGEGLSRKVVLHKAYCRMAVRMLDRSGGNAPFTLSFHDRVVGYLPGGEPKEGTRTVLMTPDGEGICRLNIFRQKDNSLSVSIMDRNETLRTFSLGEYIAASGYDWQAIDLEDILVDIDYAACLLSLNRDMWSGSHESKIEL